MRPTTAMVRYETHRTTPVELHVRSRLSDGTYLSIWKTPGSRDLRHAVHVAVGRATDIDACAKLSAMWAWQLYYLPPSSGRLEEDGTITVHRPSPVRLVHMYTGPARDGLVESVFFEIDSSSGFIKFAHSNAMAIGYGATMAQAQLDAANHLFLTTIGEDILSTNCDSDE